MKRPLTVATFLTGIRRGGDSNPRRLLTLHDFQSCTFDHSDTSPVVNRRQVYIKDSTLFKSAGSAVFFHSVFRTAVIFRAS